MVLVSPRFASNQRLQSAAVKGGGRPLKRVESSDGVGLVQDALRELGYALPVSFRKTGSADTIYGDETATVVRRFQTDQRLTMLDGIAGHETLHRLDQLFLKPTPPPPPPAPTPVPPGPQTAVTVRKNVFQLDATEQNRFYNNIDRLNKSGVYARLVNYHRQMGFHMHSRYVDENGSMFHPEGICRFLSWHRVYVRKLELEMQKFDPGAFIPYWHWTDSNPKAFPEWLNRFIGMPVNLPPVGALPKADVTISRPATKPDEKQSLVAAANGVGAALASRTYLSFTTLLEAGPHNAVHGWFGPGATMFQYISPADPIFWMHHAEVDRLWAIWQWTHPNQNPPFHEYPPGILFGEYNNLPVDRAMEPMEPPNQERDFRDTVKAGYSYDSMVP